jgi:hypothetical protein
MPERVDDVLAGEDAVGDGEIVHKSVEIGHMGLCPYGDR